MPNKGILIQCALPVEFDALTKAVVEVFSLPAAPEKKTQKKRDFFKVDLKKGASDLSIVGFRGGIGKIWAAASAEFAIEYFKPELVIDFGLCGSVDPTLKHGDILIADKIIEYDVQGFTNVPSVDLKSARGLTSTAFRIGPLLSGDRNVVGAAERKALFEQHKALGACWEAAAVARIAKFHGLDCLSFRGVSDIGAGPDLVKEFNTHGPATATKAATELAKLLLAL